MSKGWHDYFRDWSVFEKWLVFLSTLSILAGGMFFQQTADDIIWTWLGIISAVTGNLCLVLVGKGKICNYYYGAVYGVTFVAVAYHNLLYGQALVTMFYYLPMTFLGYCRWKQAEKTHLEEVLPMSMGWCKLIVMFIAIIVGTFLYGFALKFLEGNFVFMDALVVVLLIAALVFAK